MDTQLVAIKDHIISFPSMEVILICLSPVNMTRKRQYGMRKQELIATLYQLQEPICPLCKRSLLPEIHKWIQWRERTLVGGMRVRRKDANLNIDHIIAVAEGGTDELDNLALTHRRCNDIRGTAQLYEKRPKRGV